MNICPHCGKAINEVEKVKWYLKTSFVIVAFLALGPLALPLLWINPRFRLRTKLIVSLIIVVFTYYFTILVADSIKTLWRLYQQIYTGTI